MTYNLKNTTENNKGFCLFLLNIGLGLAGLQLGLKPSLILVLEFMF